MYRGAVWELFSVLMLWGDKNGIQHVSAICLLTWSNSNKIGQLNKNERWLAYALLLPVERTYDHRQLVYPVLFCAAISVFLQLFNDFSQIFFGCRLPLWHYNANCGTRCLCLSRAVTESCGVDWHASGMPVLTNHLRCSSVVGLFDVCWPSAHRDIPSSSCSIWSVGVCDDCRGTS